MKESLRQGEGPLVPVAEIYPYVPGKGGIPFDQILRKVKMEQKSMGTIPGGSGRTLAYLMSEKRLTITDPAASGYILDVVYTNGLQSLLFGVCTRPATTLKYVQDRARGVLTSTGKHRDLFAGKFVGYSLWYFETYHQKPVQKINDIWNEGSDNLRQLQQCYKETQDISMAAYNTWSPQVFARYGFSDMDTPTPLLDTQGRITDVMVNFRRDSQARA